MFIHDIIHDGVLIFMIFMIFFLIIPIAIGKGKASSPVHGELWRSGTHGARENLF